MPSKIFYTIVGAEILRIARTTTESENFKLSCAKIISNGETRKYHQKN